MGDHNLTCRSPRCSGLGAEQNIVRDMRDLTFDVANNLESRVSNQFFLARPAGLARRFSASP
jgi:hypothetical protein